MPTSPILACTRIAAIVIAGALGVVPAAAQDGFARESQLQSLGQDLSDISSRVQGSVVSTIEAMENLSEYSGDAQTEQAFALLDSIEAETRQVIDTIKITSPFMTALDDARAQVIVLLRKNERDPESPQRNARIVALTEALASINEQSEKILAAEGVLTSLLGEHAVMRSNLIRDGEVRQVQSFVNELGTLTDGLEQMALVLSEISNSVITSPPSAALASE